MNNYEWHNEKIGQRVVNSLKKNNFDAIYFSGREEAVQYVMNYISSGISVGIGGSVTVKELDIVQKASEKGAVVLDHNIPELPAEEKLKIRRQQLLSDVFICSSNAITLDGALVNLDGVGNRVAAMTFGPGKVIVIAGINKVCRDVHAAHDRLKLIASPLNNKRLDKANPCVETGICMDCQTKDRICNVYSVMRKKPSITDMTVVIIGENLGY